VDARHKAGHDAPNIEAVRMSYAALAAGIAAGWWYRDPRSGDEVSAWLERGPDER